MWLGKDAWLAGEDPRPHFEAGHQAFEEALKLMPGQPAAVAQFGSVVDMEAGILLALGEDPAPKLEDLVERMDALLKKIPGLTYLEGIEGELLVDDGYFRAMRGGDPTPLLARARPLLDRARRLAPDDLALTVAQALASIAEAHWDVSQGRDPGERIAGAEKVIPTTLGPRAGADISQEVLARASLERARWLVRVGNPATAAATEGLGRIQKALERRSTDPDLWVLKAQLEAFAGDDPTARESLAKAWSINRLVKAGPASRAAEAQLASR